jgi:hypothetical protein
MQSRPACAPPPSVSRCNEMVSGCNEIAMTMTRTPPNAEANGHQIRYFPVMRSIYRSNGHHSRYLAWKQLKYRLFRRITDLLSVRFAQNPIFYEIRSPESVRLRLNAGRCSIARLDLHYRSSVALPDARSTVGLTYDLVHRSNCSIYDLQCLHFM